MLPCLRTPYLAAIVLGGLAMTLGLVLSGCCTTGGTLPTSDELASMAATPEGTSHDALWRGRALVVTECAECHRLFWPNEYAPEAWPGLVIRMGRKMPWSSGQIADMTRYLVAASQATGGGGASSFVRAALEPNVDAEALQRGKSLALANCAECHRFYEPHEYSPNAWPGIVQSMADSTDVTTGELLDIARYYVNAARQER